jgi:hypothetical protein
MHNVVSNTRINDNVKQWINNVHNVSYNTANDTSNNH